MHRVNKHTLLRSQYIQHCKSDITSFQPNRPVVAIQGSRHFLVNQGHQNVEQGLLEPPSVTQLFNKFCTVMEKDGFTPYARLSSELVEFNPYVHPIPTSSRLILIVNGHIAPKLPTSLLLELYVQNRVFVSACLLHSPSQSKDIGQWEDAWSPSPSHFLSWLSVILSSVLRSAITTNLFPKNEKYSFTCVQNILNYRFSLSVLYVYYNYMANVYK
jgi:hypothetical protein